MSHGLTIHREKGPKIPQVIAFDPAWLDENGFMTKVPSIAPEAPLAMSLPVDDKTTQAIGTYIHASEHLNGDGTPDGVTSEELLRFSIGRYFIIQELPRNRRAIISPGNRIDVEVVAGTRQWRKVEEWRPFWTEDKRTCWRRISRVKPTYAKPQPHRIPYTQAALLEEVTRCMAKAVRLLGHAAKIDSEDWIGDGSDPLTWVFAPIQRVNDATDWGSRRPGSRGYLEAWPSLAPTDKQHELWRAIVTEYTGIAEASKIERTQNKHSHDRWVCGLANLTQRLLNTVAPASPDA